MKMMHTELGIVSRMETIYQSMNISMAVMIIEDDVEINVKKLEDILNARNFPLGHSLIIVGPDRLESAIIDYAPDCIILVTDDQAILSTALTTVEGLNNVRGRYIIVTI